MSEHADVREVALADIADDASLQLRASGIDATAVADYADAMDSGTVLPPIILFFDGTHFHLADGWHRRAAASQIGRKTISADVRPGGRREALLFAAGANAHHGLRRSSADKRKAIAVLLRDPEWQQLPNREIARACSVDHKSVAKARRELAGPGDFPSAPPGDFPSVPHSRPTDQQHPVARAGSTMIEKMLTQATTESLVAELRRRGIEVVDG